MEAARAPSKGDTSGTCKDEGRAGHQESDRSVEAKGLDDTMIVSISM